MWEVNIFKLQAQIVSIIFLKKEISKINFFTI